ncbi:MAG TPA: sel1 repeat family protein, partial [Gammaproteobacteria bacterium]|nr:sel1 repeat family protein [Gammaproteobacteria bacterium]
MIRSFIEPKVKPMKRFIACTLLILSLPLASLPALADSTDQEQFKLDLIMAKRGDFDAQFSVGAAYEYGRGVKKDLKQAFYWYKKAASNGHHRAQFKVGEFYERGIGGVKKDLRNAKIWYRLATMGNIKEARIRLQRLEKTGDRPAPAARKAPPAPPKPAKTKPRTRPKTAKAPRPATPPPARPHQKPAKPKAKSKPKPPAPRYSPEELANLLKTSQWQGVETVNTVLPMAGARCLSSGKSKIICFSPEQRHTVGSYDVIFTTKATLSDLQPNGRFKVEYLFNVSKLQPAADPGPALDPF